MEDNHTYTENMGESVHFLAFESSKWEKTLSDARESEKHPLEEASLLTSDTGMAGIARRERDSLGLLGDPAARP